MTGTGKGPGIYAGGAMVLPAADPDELEEGLGLEVEYERAREAVVEVARALWAGTLPSFGLLGAAVAAHDKAREAYRAHGGSVDG